MSCKRQKIDNTANLLAHTDIEPYTVIRLSQNFCVRNFRVTIFSFISNAHRIFTVYNITSKQFRVKNFVVLHKTKILKFANYGIHVSCETSFKTGFHNY